MEIAIAVGLNVATWTVTLVRLRRAGWKLPAFEGE